VNVGPEFLKQLVWHEGIEVWWQQVDIDHPGIRILHGLAPRKLVKNIHGSPNQRGSIR
jgi:hypothetical protein